MKRILSLFAFLCLAFMLILSCETGNEPNSPVSPTPEWHNAEIVSITPKHIFLVGYQIMQSDFSVVYYDEIGRSYDSTILPSTGLVLKIGSDENTLRTVEFGKTRYEATDTIFSAQVADENHPAKTCTITCKKLEEMENLTLTIASKSIYQDTTNYEDFYGAWKSNGALLGYTESFITTDGKVAENVTITIYSKDNTTEVYKTLNSGEEITATFDEMKKVAKDAALPSLKYHEYPYTVGYTLGESTVPLSGRAVYINVSSVNKWY